MNDTNGLSGLSRGLFAAFVVCCSAPAIAHVTVSPKTSAVGAWEKYEIRLPNEKEVATTGLEVRFPAGLKIKSFEDKPGWQISIVRNSTGAITGARWTGQLPPERFVELGIIAVNPTTGGDLVWSAVQTFADGTSISWSGPEGSPTPAPRVMIKASSN